MQCSDGNIARKPGHPVPAAAPLVGPIAAFAEAVRCRLATREGSKQLGQEKWFPRYFTEYFDSHIQGVAWGSLIERYTRKLKVCKKLNI